MTLRRVRLRLLPWRPRWRTGEVRDVPDLPFADLDDPLSLVIGLLFALVVAPFAILFVIGVALLGTELLAVAGTRVYCESGGATGR